MATANMMPAVAPQPAAGPPAPMPGPPMPPPQAPGAQQLLPGPPPPDSGELTPDGRKAKRELSQSKRAAQNRAAQVSEAVVHAGLSGSARRAISRSSSSR
ncbi:hypothetical protein MAPG_01806 [Magnaporthiopsis poae ATCC 64411]|uniref:Uncharacterized protein n=1 Tax=Magnaporthiopsis poae (strain ATCC 64411 / 73-15) TaxID=644358 RepID=A0A0C4DPN5_MAGP6|nr:hypothetical protein MAPG_01806 [Magnaporthiopsis poae ATCC 64411]